MPSGTLVCVKLISQLILFANDKHSNIEGNRTNLEKYTLNWSNNNWIRLIRLQNCDKSYRWPVFIIIGKIHLLVLNQID